MPTPGPLSISNNLCLSRSVRDTAAFLSVVEDKNVPSLPAVGYVEGPSTERLRIAVLVEPFRGKEPHPEVAAGAHDAAALCRELGHEVAEISLPFDGEEFVDTFIGFWAAGTLGYADRVKEWLGADADPADYLEPWTLGLARLASERTPQECVGRAQRVFPEVSAKMEAVFADYDVILSPVLRTPPYRIGEHAPTVEFDELMERVLDVVTYTPLQNAVGMPGMSVPLHWTADNLPVGVQFSAWRGEEARLLGLAYELEEASPWADRRPPVSVSAE